MNIANLNKNNTKMPFKQLSFILTILLLLFTFSFACSPAVNPTDNNTVFTPGEHIKVSDGSSDITESLTIAVDENDSTKIIISGLRNALTEKTYTLTIAPEAEIFSTEGDITITIADPDGFSPENVVLLASSFTITNDIDPSNSITYTVEVQFSGAPVEDWFNTDYIEATFARQTASLTLSEKILSVNGLKNVGSRTGTIRFNLPRGFEADPPSIDLDNPDGVATISPNPAAFKIRETGKPENFEDYTINTITLAAVTVFTPDVHISIADSSDPVLELFIEVDENDSTKIIIRGLSNADTDKTYTLTINPVTGVFSTPGNDPIIINIAEPPGFSPGNGIPLPSDRFTITNDNDSENPIPYTVEVQFSGAPVEDWFNTDYISATFASQEASLILNGYNLSVNGLINVDSGEGTIEFINLPDGFEANPESIPLIDPDDAGTGQTTFTPSPATFTISETNNSARSQEYTVNTINLSSLTVFTAGEHIVITDDSIEDPTLNDITDTLIIGVNTANLITISGLSNALTDKTYTLTIAPVEDGFSTSSGDDIIITIAEPDGFSPGDGVLSQGDGVPLPDKFTITNNNDSENPITYTLEVPFTGVQVVDWLTSGSLSTYIKATFASQEASLILNGYNLSVNGLTNVDTGTGTISFELPPGFVAVPESIPLTDPDGTGTGQNTINLSPDNTFTISETDNSDNNSETYTVNPISLSSLSVFTPGEHIKVSDGSTDITDGLTFGVDEDDSNNIIISGLINAVTEKTYTLTITSVADVFSTPGNNPIAINIAEPTGFSPGVVVPPSGFTITNDIDSSEIPYTVEVQFSGALVEDWITGYITFINYFTGATFAGQTLDNEDFRVFSGFILINGEYNLNNVPGAVPQLTTMDFPSGYMLTQNLRAPAGNGLDAIANADVGFITIAEEGNTANTKTYTVRISLAAYTSPVMASHISVIGFDNNPIDSNDITILIEQNIITISGLTNGTSGSASVTITPPTTGEYTVEPDSLTFDDPPGTDVAEPEDTVEIVSAAGFTVSHTVRLNLKAYESPVEASHVTAMFNSIPASQSKIVINGADIIISGFFNIAGSAGSGTVSIMPPAGEYTVIPINSATPLPLTFTDPDGTDSEEIRVGLVNVTSAGVTVLHTIIISFSAPIELIITSDKVENSRLTITSDATVTLTTTLGACELLPQPTFEIDGIPSVTVTGFPSYFDRRMGTAPGLDTYTVNRVLIIEDANGEVLDDNFTVSVAGFPACNDATNVFTNTGTADDPYLINSAPKLELLSYLVENDNTTYANKSYKLTDDIDLGLASLPWSETASGESGEGFPPVGLTDTTFQGTFDCANNSISNLYINKANDDNIGLFGITSGASIQNCSLMNVNVTGNNNVGGLGGNLDIRSSITNSYATGSVSGNDKVGGLAGYLNEENNITYSYATGSVTGNNDVGGLAGNVTLRSNIKYSYATGEVSGSLNVGGLVGLKSYTSIENSYATGSVSGTSDVGGLVGNIPFTSSITNSYATGEVSGTPFSYTGGLVGRDSTNVHHVVTITNSYWDTETSKQASSEGGGTGKATNDLKTGSVGMDIFTGWNSPPDDNVWEFSPDTQYPRLKTVVCANRQYADPSNVPTECTALP